MSVCRECGVALTREEAEYYDDRCEGCEVEWHERIVAWREGGEDMALDALFSGPAPVMH